MTFQADVATAKASGKPFRIEHNTATGKSTVVYLTPTEISRDSANAVMEATEKQARSDATALRLQRLRDASTVRELGQWIEDELL